MIRFCSNLVEFNHMTSDVLLQTF